MAAVAARARLGVLVLRARLRRVQPRVPPPGRLAIVPVRALLPVVHKLLGALRYLEDVHGEQVVLRLLHLPVLARPVLLLAGASRRHSRRGHAQPARVAAPTPLHHRRLFAAAPLQAPPALRRRHVGCHLGRCSLICGRSSRLLPPGAGCCGPVRTFSIQIRLHGPLPGQDTEPGLRAASWARAEEHRKRNVEEQRRIAAGRTRSANLGGRPPSLCQMRFRVTGAHAGGAAVPRGKGRGLA